MPENLKTLKWPLSFIAVTLVLSYAYSAYVLLTPEGLRHFNYIMFIPGSLAIVWRLLEKRSLLEPLRIPNLSSIAFALVYPVVVILVCALVAQATGLATIDWSALPDAISGFTLIQFLWATAFVLGEEYGWRGYLFPTLSKKIGTVRAVTVVGIVWAIWHGPLVYGLATKLETAQSPLLLTLVQMTVVFLFSFPFAYAFLISGSVFAPFALHFVWNWINPDILGNIYRNLPGLAKGDVFVINGEGIIGALVATAFAVWFCKRFGKKSVIPNN